DLQGLLALKTMFGEFFPQPAAVSPVVSTAESDFNTTVALKRLELESAKTMAEIEIMRERAKTDTELRKQEIAAETERAGKTAATFAQWTEVIKPIAADLLQQFQGRNQASGMLTYEPTIMQSQVPEHPQPTIQPSSDLTSIDGGIFVNNDLDLNDPSVMECGVC